MVSGYYNPHNQYREPVYKFIQLFFLQKEEEEEEKDHIEKLPIIGMHPEYTVSNVPFSSNKFP